jgi:hypothetical protein
MKLLFGWLPSYSLKLLVLLVAPVSLKLEKRTHQTLFSLKMSISRNLKAIQLWLLQNHVG